MRTMKPTQNLATRTRHHSLCYKSVDAEVIGNKQKKKLAVEPVEAETVIRPSTLPRTGWHHRSAGTKKIAEWLNARGYRSRPAHCRTGTIHEILTRRAYTGIRNFNEFARKSDGERKASPKSSNTRFPRSSIKRPSKRFKPAGFRHPRSKGPRLSAAPSLLGDWSGAIARNPAR